MKAKHATMLLTVTEVEGLSERMEELDSEDMLPAHSAHPSVVMVSNERVIHIYLSGSLQYCFLRCCEQDCNHLDCLLAFRRCLNTVE